jgi:hypothetical protein
MPANLTDSNAFTSPVVVPADGDPANAASIVQTGQPLANRTYFLQQLCEVLGIKKIRAGSAAAMVAATGIANKTIWLIEAAGAFQGIYVYDSTSPFVADNSFVYPATGMGAGAWVHILFSLLNANLGLVAIGPISLGGAGISATPANKIDPTLVTYGNVQALYATPSTGGNVNNATTNYIDIPGYTLAVPDSVVGDILLVDMQLPVWDVAAHIGSFQPVVVDGASTNALGVIQVGPAGVGDNFYGTTPISFSGAYTVVTGGALTVKAQFKTNTAGGDVNANSTGGSRIRVLHVRP